MISLQVFSHFRSKIVKAAFFLSMAFWAVNLFAAEPKTIKVMALGDSTTAGNPGFRSPVEAPPAGEGDEKSQYAYWMMRRNPEYDVLNRGVSGERTSQIFKRFKKYIETEAPDVVIVLAGVNDLYSGSSVEKVEMQLQEIYALAMQKNIKIVACTILPYDRAAPEIVKKIVQVNTWIRSFSKKNGFLFCDTFRIAGHPEKFGKLRGSPDGMHPDIDGYKRMGEALAITLEHHFN